MGVEGVTRQMAKYVTYLRLSRNSKNGRNYGLEAQRRDLDIFLAQFCPDESGCQEISSFTEIQSGAEDDRPELAKAIALCQETGATLLVSKLDRLSRKVSFIARLLETKNLNFKVASMPNADKFQLHIYAALAEQEREFISARTKAGLARAKEAGKVLGGVREGQEKARKATQNKAARFAESLRPIIIPMLQNSDKRPSLREIAESLESAGIKTASGKSQWSPMTVSRIIKNLELVKD